MSRAEDDAIDALLARSNEEGDAAFALAIPRADNPHVHGADKRAIWFSKWDACALQAAQLMKTQAARDLYNACLAAASLLRDMSNNPRTLSTRMPRYREVQVEINTALTRAMDSSLARSDCRSGSRPERAQGDKS